MLFLAVITVPDDLKALALCVVVVVEALRESRSRRIRRKLAEVEERLSGKQPSTRPARSNRNRRTRKNA